MSDSAIDGLFRWVVERVVVVVVVVVVVAKKQQQLFRTIISHLQCILVVVVVVVVVDNSVEVTVVEGKSVVVVVDIVVVVVDRLALIALSMSNMEQSGFSLPQIWSIRHRISLFSIRQTFDAEFGQVLRILLQPSDGLSSFS